MYEYVNPENKHLKELREYGEGLVLDILTMLPDEYKKNIQLIEHGLATNNYEEIQRGVHSIKANLRYFIDVSNPVITFCQGFESRAREKKEDLSNVDRVVDFTPDYQKLKAITEKPLLEIKHFRDELAGNIS